MVIFLTLCSFFSFFLSLLSLFLFAHYINTHLYKVYKPDRPQTTNANEKEKQLKIASPRDVDQKRFALRDLRDDVLRRVRGFRGDDGGSNESGGSDGGLFDTFRCSRYRLRKRRIFR